MCLFGLENVLLSPPLCLFVCDLSLHIGLFVPIYFCPNLLGAKRGTRIRGVSCPEILVYIEILSAFIL